MTTATMASRSASGDSGFFGNVFSGIGEGLGTVASQILPIWAAQQLKTENEDQLRDLTFQRSLAALRVDDVATQEFRAQPAAFDFFNNINLGSGGILLIGVAVVGGIVAAKLL